MKAALSALLVCAAIATAHAQEVVVEPPAIDAQAKAHAQGLLSEGTAAYGRGDYATALDKFTAAYEIFPSPKLWFNIGQANRDSAARSRRWRRSIASCATRATRRPRRWPRRAAPRPSWKAKLGQIQVTCATDGAEITVDGQVGSTPLGEMVWTTPGRHQVAVYSHPDLARDRGRRVLAGAGLPRELQSCADSICAAPNPTGNGAMVAGRCGGLGDHAVYRHTWFWVATGVVIGAGIAAGVLIVAPYSFGRARNDARSQRAF